MMIHIKGIIWDFGNIMARFDLLKACEELAKHGSKLKSAEAIRDALFVGIDAPAKLHETGILTPFDFFCKVRDLVGLGQKFPINEFIGIWQDIFEENKGVSTVISKLRPDVKKCICSNADPIHWLAIERLPVIEAHFSIRHVLVLSYRMKARKPDVKMYHEALSRLDLTADDAHQVLYVEDIAEYRDAFKALGGNVLAYDCSKDPITVLENGLRDFGVLRT